MMKRLFNYILLFTTLSLIIVACGGAEQEVAPTVAAATVAQAQVEVPTVAPAEPTAIPPTVTLEPAPETPLPPPVVNEEPATPTAVVEPTLVPAEIPVDEESAALYLAEEADFAAENRSRLTGEIVENPENLDRRPILCKISNSPPEWVRPQSGLNSADIIFEHFAEGVITRFTALFHSQTPETVGPIRSARLIDVELPLMYDGALCFSGAAIGTSRKIYNTSFVPRILRSDYPGYYRTGEDKPFEHTFYNQLDEAWAHLDELGQNNAPSFTSQMVFGSELPANTAEAGYVSIQHGRGTFVEWRYDAEAGKYYRWADGSPVIDAIDGEQVSASNVIVVKAPHFLDRNICETQTETECIAFSTEIQIWGSGFASIFRDGRQMNGSWSRADRFANGMMFTFFDDQGNPMPLQVGNSWIQVVPYTFIDTVVSVEP